MIPAEYLLACKLESMATAGPGVAKAFGQVIVAGRSSQLLYRPRKSAEVVDNLIALCFGAGALHWKCYGQEIGCPPDGALLIDVSEYAGLAGSYDFILLLPGYVLPGALANGPATAIEGSGELLTLRKLLHALLRQGNRYVGAQADLIGRAVIEMLGAVLARNERASPLVQQRGRLFDRLTAYIDMHLADELDVEALCRNLYCSRSAIYRVAAPVGGIATLLRERRLTAIFRRLCDPDEQASIAELGRAHGFPDAANLSARFKRRFGITARQLRHEHALGAGNA